MDKRCELSDIISAIKDGYLLAIGGGGLQRKPMAAVKAIAKSGLQNLRVATFFGGPDVDLLLACGKISHLSFAYVGMDVLGLSPQLRVSREAGSLAIHEYSEATFIAALRAGIQNVPFMPSRSGEMADFISVSGSPFRRFACPLTGEILTAVPALKPDVAIIHANWADRTGNVCIRGDCFMDVMLCRGSGKVFVVADRVVERIHNTTRSGGNVISRIWIEGVCEAKRGSGFTGSFPDVPIDFRALRQYLASIGDPDWRERFLADI